MIQCQTLTPRPSLAASDPNEWDKAQFSVIFLHFSLSILPAVHYSILPSFQYSNTMGTEVTKNDLAAVNKRIDNAAKAFNDLKKEVDSNQGELIDSINGVMQSSMDNLTTRTVPLEKRIAALEARIAALEKK